LKEVVRGKAFESIGLAYVSMIERNVEGQGVVKI
jgi:hypothetical protein